MSTCREDFERDGFVIIPELVPLEQVQALKAECQRVLAAHAPGRSVFVGASVVSPLCNALACASDLLQVLAQLLPGGVAFLSDKVVVKDGRNRFATPWHQDASYWPGTRAKLSVWIALDDALEANGALRVIPGSHHQRAVHAQAAQGHVVTGEFTNALALGDNPSGALTVAVPAGAAVIFSDLLVHGSHPNRTGGDRVSLINTYHQPAADEAFDLDFPARRVLVRPGLRPPDPVRDCRAADVREKVHGGRGAGR